MTTATILLAVAGLAILVFWTGVGAWMGARFTHAHRDQSDHIKRFNRDEDVDDAADMATDDS